MDNGDVTGIDISAIREIKYLQELRSSSIYVYTIHQIHQSGLRILPMDLEKLIKKNDYFHSMDLKLIIVNVKRC